MRKIKIATKNEKEILRNILYEYLTELSQFDPSVKFDKNKVPIYNWFNSYFEDNDRFPFLFLIENKIIGFSLIRELEINSYELAEFYIQPCNRKDNNSMWFAINLAKMFSGKLTLSAIKTNKRAIKFWNKFIKNFEQHSFEESSEWIKYSIKLI